MDAEVMRFGYAVLSRDEKKYKIGVWLRRLEYMTAKHSRY